MTLTRLAFSATMTPSSVTLHRKATCPAAITMIIWTVTWTEMVQSIAFLEARSQNFFSFDIQILNFYLSQLGG